MSRTARVAGVVATVGAVVLLPPSVASAGKSCVEVSDVVGEQQCSRYGTGWTREHGWALVLDAAVVRTEFGLAGRTFTAKSGKDGPTLYEFDGARAADVARTTGFSLRMLAAVGGSVYLGLEQTFGFGHLDGRSFRVDGYDVTPASGLSIVGATFGLPLGVRVPLGKVSLRGEVLGGFTILGLTQEANGARASATWVGGALEGRGWLDVWLATDTTLSVLVGRDLLGRGDTRLGLSLAFHTRAYDGAMF